MIDLVVMGKAKKKKPVPCGNADACADSSVNSGQHDLYCEPVFDLPSDSPLKVQGNLTGIPRRLKDIAADWYNARNKWKKHSAEGYEICSQIGSIKMDAFSDTNPLPATLLPLCDSLEKVIESLQLLKRKMCDWTAAFDAIKCLLESQNRADKIIFQTWRIDHFIEASDELCKMFCAEFSVKQSIYENICHSRCKEELLVLLSIWSHEPYIQDSILLNINAMVVECGHIAA